MATTKVVTGSDSDGGFIQIITVDETNPSDTGNVHLSMKPSDAKLIGTLLLEAADQFLSEAKSE